MNMRAIGSCNCTGCYNRIGIVIAYVVISAAQCAVNAFDVGVVVTSTKITRRLWSPTSTTHLYSSPSPQQRQPRRNLQKRPRKNRKPSVIEQQHMNGESTANRYGSGLMVPTYQQPQLHDEDFPWDTAESRTIISARAREAGEDYWIDMEELQRIEEQQQRQQQLIKPRDPDQISDQKLWIEVLSPYKQNWIGLISVSMIVFAFIFKYFPEVIDPPIITNVPEIL